MTTTVGVLSSLVDYLESKVTTARASGKYFVVITWRQLKTDVESVVGHDVAIATVGEVFDIMRLMHPDWYIVFGRPEKRKDPGNDCVIDWRTERSGILEALATVRQTNGDT